MTADRSQQRSWFLRLAAGVCLLVVIVLAGGIALWNYVGPSQVRQAIQRQVPPVIVDDLVPRAEAGDVGAMVELAMALMRDRRHEEARRWWLRAAEAENLHAQSTVARAYDNGHLYGFSKDPVEAARWHRRLASRDTPNVARYQVRLGEMYRDGNGVDQSDADAVAWFRAATRHGNGYGFLRLAEMTAAGRGTPVDPVEAYRLAYLAEHGRGTDDSDFRLSEQARQFQETLSGKIGSGAAAEAERRAREERHELFNDR